MNLSLSRFRSLFVVGVLCLGSIPGGFAAELLLHKVPALTVDQAAAYPENVARYDLGARMIVSNPDSAAQKAAEAALLNGDPAASYALPVGTTTLLVSLPKIENLGRISLANKGAKGSLAVATGNAKLPVDSPQWHNILQQDLSSDGIQEEVGPSEAKYVRLTFAIAEPGQIGGLGLYPSAQISDFTKPRAGSSAGDESRSFGLISYNYTDMHAKARALYVSSGSDIKQANNMIDEQTATSYRFAAEDGSPTTVIDLGEAQTLHRLSALYAPRSGRMEFYVLQSLPVQAHGGVEAKVAEGNDPAPASEVALDTVILGDADIANLKAVGSVTDDGSLGSASVEFAAATGRYVMVRWTPAAAEDGSFSLAEIAALGGSGNSSLLAANTEAATGATGNAESGTNNSDGKTLLDGKTMLEGKSMIDAKDMPAEGPAEGPPLSLPQPPPFTFVPVLLPRSP